MNMTRWYLGVALVFTSIVGNFSAYAEEEARDMEEVVVTSRHLLPEPKCKMEQWGNDDSL